MQDGPCLSPYRHLKVDGAACGAKGASSGHLLSTRFVTLQELQKGLEGATKTCGWLRLCLPGLLAAGLCVG